MRSRSEKKLLILIIFLCMAFLSVGFAAFTSNLKIDLTVDVAPDSSDFAVRFSTGTTVSSVKSTESVTPSSYTSGITVENATISNNSILPTISNLKAIFANPGDYVEYTFYVVNTGEYDAYLNSINFVSTGSYITCTANYGTDDDLVQSACSSLHISVKVGSDAAVTSTSSNIQNHKLNKKGYEEVKIRIYYDSTGSRADGSFNVTIGDINLIYSSVSVATS